MDNEGIDYYSYLWKEIFVEVYATVCIILVDVLLEVLVRYLVAVFVLAVVFTLLLDSVIRQMDEPVLQIVQVKFLARSSDVPVLIEVALHPPVDRSHHPVHTDIKLPAIDEQRSLNVFLNDMCVFLLVHRHNLSLDLPQTVAHEYPRAPI